LCPVQGRKPQAAAQGDLHTGRGRDAGNG